MTEFHRIETIASAVASQVRAHDFPALEEGNLSFPSGRYVVDFERRSDGSANRSAFFLIHRVEGAPLLERLIEEEANVEFVCTVSAPLSSFRSTKVSGNSGQLVEWNEDDLGEPPLLTPMIVVSKPFTLRLDEGRDGVHGIWDGQEVHFEPGMRLAVGSVVQLRSSVFPLLSFHEDNTLKKGSFRVTEETEHDFRFRVNLAADLHRFLHYGTNDSARDYILTHIVGACLSRLKSNWSADSEDDSWRSYRSLEALSEQLHSQGMPDWTDDEFSPELVATWLHPHKVPDTVTPEDDE